MEKKSKDNLCGNIRLIKKINKELKDISKTICEWWDYDYQVTPDYEVCAELNEIILLGETLIADEYFNDCDLIMEEIIKYTNLDEFNKKDEKEFKKLLRKWSASYRKCAREKKKDFKKYFYLIGRSNLEVLI